jgi:hypothetical protein
MDLGDFFKAAVWDNIVKAALGRLFVFLPILGWGPIGFVVSWVVTHFTNQLYDLLKEAIQMEAIALRNESHRKAYERASVVLKVIALDKGINSPEFQKARDEHKRSLTQLIRFGA